MKQLNLLIKGLLVFAVFLLFAINSRGSKVPVTFLGNIENANPGEQVTIPVKVNDFEDIAGFTLALDYDYSKLHFIKGQSNSLLGGTYDIGDIDLGNGMHRLTISWYKSGVEGVSLKDESVLVEYTFKFICGPANLTWFDNGPSCVYNDLSANSLDDLPTSEFYVNGVIAETSNPKPIINASGPLTFLQGENLTLLSSKGETYLWSTGDTTSSIVVYEMGVYTVQTTDIKGIVSEPSDPVDVNVIAIGNTQLEFRLDNPRIITNSVNNYLEFDVQLRVDSDVYWLWDGQINLDFNKMTLSSNETNWETLPDTLLMENNSIGNTKYNIDLSISGSVLTLDIHADANTQNLPASENDFVKIGSEYLTLVSLKCVIISDSGNAGIDFVENEMNGSQFYKISEVPWYESFHTTNHYDPAGIVDISSILTNSELNKHSENISVYTNSYKQIVIEGDVENGAAAQLYDLQGRFLRVEKINSTRYNIINVSDMKGGIYVLLLKQNGRNKSFKINITK